MVRIGQKQLNLIKTKVSCYLQFPQASHFFSQAEQLPELSPSRHINNSFSVYHFLDSESQLGKSKELNNQAMKVHVKRAFISHSFLLQKKKSRQALHEIFFNPKYSCEAGASTPYFKIQHPLFCCLLFQRKSQPRDQY